MKQEDWKISQLFMSPLDVDVVNAKEIVVQVYRKSVREVGWEVPETRIGIQLYEDEKLKEDFYIHQFSNYGIFSYTAIHRHKTMMEFALHLADFIANKVIYSFEAFTFKVKKKLISNQHIYQLEIPSEYIVTMPPPNKQKAKEVEFLKREVELDKKQKCNPGYDITEEKKKLDNDIIAFINENVENEKNNKRNKK